MTELAPYLAIAVSAVALLFTVAQFWLKLGGDSKGGELKAESAESKARSAESLAQACLAKHELMSAQLAEYRERMAGQIAEIKALASETGRNLIAAEVRLSESIDKMGERFDHMTERFDALIAKIVAKGL